MEEILNYMSKQKTLTINKNCVFKPKIEDKADFEESFFKDSYAEANKYLEEIVNFEYDKNDNSNDFNNIIAFVGDRGSGKTSTMKSFRKSLDKDYEIKGKKNNFELLDIIDPMLFSNKDSIIEIVVGQMFKEFKDTKSDDNLMKKKVLAKKFEKVYKDLKIINSSKGSLLEQSYDNLEALVDLSSAISLKEDLSNLIKAYIEYKESSDKFIVISIDDLDMNLTVGEKMLEDIRKYLILPNVIILMAVKFEQLEEVVRQKFVNDLKGNLDLARCINKEKEFKEGIDNKTEKYLEKLIPFSRRIHMPKLSANGINLKIDDFHNIDTKDKNGKELNSISSIINYNLNKKIGYIIFDKDHYNAIITQNLRLFIDFIMMLNNMKSRDESENYKIENIAKFKTYIRDILISYINDIKKRKELIDILECEFNKLNGKALFYLNECINEYSKGSKEIEDTIIKERVEWINKNKLIINEERIEYGDIVTWVKMVKMIKANLLKDDSIEMFKCIYSLRLLETFYKNPITLFKETRFNFVGDYFSLTHNKNSGCLSRDVKFSTKEMKKFTNYDFRFAIFEIIFYRSENLDKYKNLDRYNRLIRREKKEYLIEDEFTNFTNFELSSLNMVSYCMYKNILDVYIEKYKEKIDGNLQGQIKYLKNELDDSVESEDENKKINLDEQYSLIINIDFWMKILNELDSIVQSYNGKSPLESMGKNLENINELFNKFCSLYNIEFSYENNRKDRIVNEEKITEFKEFIKNNGVYLTNNPISLENYTKAKENIKKLKEYLNSKINAEGMSRFESSATDKLNLIDKELKKDQEQNYNLEEVRKEISKIKTSKEHEGSDENKKNIATCIKLVEVLEKDIDDKIEEFRNSSDSENKKMSSNNSTIIFNKNKFSTNWTSMINKIKVDDNQNNKKNDQNYGRL